ncbi:MAG: HyaD/HybD family hydrogenase maturation endopeptidase [Hyphomicrobiaceae bacterium]
MKRGILILGLGNTLLSDDGVGVHIVEMMRDEYAANGDVKLRDGGTLGLALLPDIKESRALILVDAAECGAAPGDVRCFIGDDMDRRLGGKKRTAHEVAAADLLDAAQLTGHRPTLRALVAVQPGSTEWGLEPTGAVLAAVPRACAEIRQLVAAWQAGGPA